MSCTWAEREVVWVKRSPAGIAGNLINVSVRRLQTFTCLSSPSVSAETEMKSLLWKLKQKPVNPHMRTPATTPHSRFTAGNKWEPRWIAMYFPLNSWDFSDRPRLSSVSKLFQADPLLYTTIKRRPSGSSVKAKQLGAPSCTRGCIHLPRTFKNLCPSPSPQSPYFTQ